MIGGATAAKRESTVARALTVNAQVTLVRKRLALGEPDRVPRLLGQRFRGDHERVHRNDRAMKLREFGGVTLGRPNDDVRTNRAPIRFETSISDSGNGCLLVNRCAEFFHHASEIGH